MGRRALTIAFLCAFACSSQPGGPYHYHLVVSTDFTDAQSQAIVDAATEWQLQSLGYVDFDGQPGPDANITITVADPTTLAAEFGGGALGVDQTTGRTSHIQILQSLDPVTFHQTALHELGHALGLVHMTPGNIMCANTVCATLEVTCGDLGQLLHRTVTTNCTP